MTDRISLKWGTLKGWHLESEAALAAAQRYMDHGVAAGGVMMQRDTPEQKQALCELIDQVDGEILNEWSGEIMTKEDAKKYVLEYDTPD